VQKLTKTFKYGDHEVTLETGQIARQAGGSVMVSMGDTKVLVTVVGRREADPGRPFFPLTVNYQENSMPRAASPAAFSNVKGVRPNTRS
jgi:polyribonucleotide nucleotidyltransferase